ncbi:hypothetical protein LSAT2_018872 [Lamellibrachia satsuma]|nr:hypothetical protein LSAT2_018872 [Lamellibrachia satsuma]
MQGLYLVCSAFQGPLHYRIIAGNVTEIDHLVTHDADVYALSANSDTGSSGMSNDWICVYDYDGLPGKPVFLFDGGVSARNVTLSWQPPSCSPRNRGRAVSYMLELWKEDSEGMVEELTLPASISSYTLTNLHPYTNYTIKMAAMAHISHGEFSVRRVSTLESTPDDPPVGLSGIMVTDHQVALSWSSPHTPNGVIKKYEVIAREDGAYLWHETVHRRNFTCDVHGGITYSFTVVAINRIGRSSEATPISISTPVRAPGQISQIQLEQFNETAATLTWSRPQPPHGPIDHYVVSCHLRDEDHNEVITCNDTRPGNETKMHMFVECNDTKVFMEVRIVAVNHNGTLPLIGRWSQRKSVEMCKNPENLSYWSGQVCLGMKHFERF